MAAKKFELFMCCLGNGTTLCNKAVVEHGDYKTIGHISNAGNIKLYVKPDYIPEQDMNRIKEAAARDRNKFIDRLEPELKHGPGRVYERMLDALTMSEYLEHRKVKHRDLAESIKALMPLYLERS